jgi:hypothetical protein
MLRYLVELGPVRVCAVHSKGSRRVPVVVLDGSGEGWREARVVHCGGGWCGMGGGRE